MREPFRQMISSRRFIHLLRHSAAMLRSGHLADWRENNGLAERSRHFRSRSRSSRFPKGLKLWTVQWPICRP